MIVTPYRAWSCPNCKQTDVTHEARPHVRYHACPGLHGLTAPMIPAGSSAKVTAIERQDYIGSEIVTLNADKRPVMSVVTERADGSNDVAVFAATATAQGESF